MHKFFDCNKTPLDDYVSQTDANITSNTEKKEKRISWNYFTKKWTHHQSHTHRQVQQTEVAAILDHSITGTEIKVSGLASWTKTG